MFAQESVMDIQKEKIAHEKHLLSQGVDFKYLPNIQYSELENVYELIEWDEEYSEALNEINSSWCTWQAAKAQAVPEGFEIGRLQDRITELLDERQDLYAQINKGVAEKIELIIRDVAELPDRTSPEDWPEALIVTSGELEEILTQHLIQKCKNQEQGE